MKLTLSAIIKAKASDKIQKLSDGHGLYLEVTPATPTNPFGSKLWRWKYRYHGKERRMALGAFPVVSLAEARQKHEDGRKLLLNDDVDPMAQRKEVKVAQKIILDNSFKSVSMLWHEHWKGTKSERTSKIAMDRLEADIWPVIGHRPITEVEPSHIREVGQRAERRGTKALPKRLIGLCSMVFRYAVAHEIAKRNPATDFKPSDVLKGYTPKSHKRIDERGLPTLLHKIELYQGTPVTRMALLIMAHTFVRTHELVAARWSEIDWEAKRWTIPAHRMKQIINGQGENVTAKHIVPLATQTITLLRMLQSITGEGEFLFPAQNKNASGHLSHQGLLFALKLMGYQGIMTGHGFRGLASTILRENGFIRDHVETQLAHLVGTAVERSYNAAEYIPQRAHMMQWWANYLENARDGKPTERPESNVVEIRKAA